MNPEHDVQLPPDLLEDLRLINASSEPAPVEISPVIPDEIRQSPITIPDFILPSHEEFEKIPVKEEPRISETQEFLLAVTNARPTHIEGEQGDKSEVYATHALLSRLNRSFDNESYVFVAHWARQVAFGMAGLSFNKAPKVTKAYRKISTPDASWADAARAELDTIHDDLALAHMLKEVAEFIGKNEDEKVLAISVLGITFAQIKHYREVKAIRSAKYLAKLVAQVATPSQAEPLLEVIPAVPPTPNTVRKKYTPEELLPSPLPEFEKSSAISEPKNTHKKMMLRAIGLIESSKKSSEIDSLNKWDTWSVVHRSGGIETLGNAELVHWIRQVVFDVCDLPFNKLPHVAFNAYDTDLKIAPEDWPKHIRELKGSLENHRLLNGVIDSCLRVWGADEKQHLLGKNAAAITWAQIKHHLDMQAFKKEGAQADSSDYAALIYKLQSLSEKDAPSAHVEISPVIKLGGLAATIYTPENLIPMPLDSIIDPKTNEIIPSEAKEQERTSLQQVMDRIVHEMGAANKNKPGGYSHNSYISLTKSLLEKIIPNAELDPAILGASHWGQRIAFAIAKLGYTQYAYEVYAANDTSRISEDEWTRRLDKTTQDAYKQHSVAEMLEACLTLATNTDSEKVAARAIACLTLEQIRVWRQQNPYA